jgi:hypothetical protein
MRTSLIIGCSITKFIEVPISPHILVAKTQKAPGVFTGG